MLDRKIIPLIALALAATSCMDPNQMSGQPGANPGNAASAPVLDTFYLGGSYDKLQDQVVAQSGDKATRVTIRGTIAPNGPESWMRSAPWNEVVVTVQNLSHREVDVVSIQGVAAQGVLVEQGGMDAFNAIEQQRAASLQNQPAEQAQAPASADFNSLATNAVTSALGLGAFAPNVASAQSGVAAMQQKSHDDAQNAALAQQAADFQSVSTEYTKRSLQQAKLAPKGEITGSAFFLTSAGEITGIVVSVRENPRSDNARDITLSIPRGTFPTETASGKVTQ